MANPINLALFYEEQEHALYIARNAFGTTPLYYIHIPGHFLAFSTELKTLATLETVQKYIAVNKFEIYDFLEGRQNKLYDSSTIFSGIKSLIPGRCIKFTSKETLVTHFAKYNPSKWFALKSPGEFGEVFKNLFFRSVNRFIDDKTVIGSHLSGGLDSSSVISTVSHLNPGIKLHTFFSNTNTSLTNEGHYSLDVATKINSTHHLVDPGIADLESLILFTASSWQLERSPISPALHNSLMRASSEAGCQILLTGHGGDSIVGHGREEYINKLYLEQDWVLLKEQFDNIARAGRTRVLFSKEWTSQSASKKQQAVYKEYFRKRIGHHIRNGEIVRSINLIKIAFARFGILPSVVLQAGVTSLFKKLSNSLGTGAPNSIASQSLKHYVQDSERETGNDYAEMDQNNISYFREIIFKNDISINEEYFAVANFYNLQIGHPFYDPSLYELCLAVPSDVLFNNGMGRSPLREAMKGILPEAVRSRTDKAIFNLYTISTAQRLVDQGHDFLTDNAEVWQYVDQAKFSKALQLLKNYPEGVGMSMRTFINRTMYLAVWLQISKLK